ncbi:hypothetical protein P7C70_g9036, partial [Phenoliferia sp. Uapishka_3]
LPTSSPSLPTTSPSSSPILPSRSSPPLPSPSLPLTRTTSNTSDRSQVQDYALPLQFTPGFTPPSQDRPNPTPRRQSNLPSFVPALSFSPDDRGPYPPHLRTSASSTSPAGVRDSYYAGMTLVGAGLEGSYQSQSTNPPPSSQQQNKGKGRAVWENDEGQGQGFDAAIPEDAVQERVARIPSGGGPTTPVTGEFRDSMVGVGRNSLLRSTGPGAMGSPASQNQLLGPAPGTTNGNGGPSQPTPPHLVQQPEVCVECMMRDRDMIDVDVTGEGVWERESDQDFEEAMRWDEESSAERGSEESAGGRLRSRDGPPTTGAGGSRDSHSGKMSVNGAPPRKRLGRGQPLTTPSLKLWTSMNPPASAHRWRTLQGFLATQIHLLELERHAREATLTDRERSRPSLDSRPPPPNLLSQSGRSKSATVLPNGLVVESINVDRDEKVGRARAKSRSRALDESTSRASSYSIPLSSKAALTPDDSVRRYASGDQPWLAGQARRFSSPALKDDPSARPSSPSGSTTRGFGFGKFGRSSTDLRSIHSPRSISPGRASLGFDENRRGSVWSKFRQSASQSVLSFAPSGSMLDMHLGMSMDKHAANDPYPSHYPSSMSDPAVARHADAEQRRVLAQSTRSMRATEKKPKKKGIKGFFSKLISSDGKSRHGISASEPSTPTGPLGLEDDDSQYLAPPPPLSALANEPQYHNRSLSNSSVDSIGRPFTPTSRGGPPAHPYQMPSADYGKPGPPADRGSIMTNGSFSSVRSKPPSMTSPNPGRNGSQRPSMDYLVPDPSPPSNMSFLPRSSTPDQFDLEREEEVLYASVRREKSLPSLPSEATEYIDPSATFPFPLQHQSNLPYSSLRDARSAYSIRTPSIAPSQSRGASGG